MIELLLVILVIGIIVLAALTRGIPTTQISAIVAAELAATEIRAAQSAAIFTGDPQTIAFSGTDYVTGEETRTLPGDSVATPYTVVFNSFGEPSSEDGDSFQISNGETTSTITISSLTGKVEID